MCKKDGSPLRDGQGHFIVAHDLFNHDGKTQDGIAEAFQEFAAGEGSKFFSPRPFDSDRLSGLLEGLEATVLSVGTWCEDNAFSRLDSEYQIKAHLEAIESVKRFWGIAIQGRST